MIQRVTSLGEEMMKLNCLGVSFATKKKKSRRRGYWGCI